MSDIARSFMNLYWPSLAQEWGMRAVKTFKEYIALVKADETLRRRYYERYRRHMIGYAGEVAVHHILGHDWREIFKFNDAHAAHLPDGFIGADSYNVKTRDKNREGLSVCDAVLQEKFYVLAHYAAPNVRLVGYAFAGELEEHARDSLGHYWMPREELHIIEHFSACEIAKGSMCKCGAYWNIVSETLP
jgi:hypothetical protein